MPRIINRDILALGGVNGKTLRCINYQAAFDAAYTTPSKNVLCQFLGIGDDGLRSLAKRDPQFKRAIELGFARRKMWVMERLWAKAESSDRVLLHVATHILGHYNNGVAKHPEGDVFADEADLSPEQKTLADACRQANAGLKRIAEEGKAREVSREDNGQMRLSTGQFGKVK